MACGKNYSLAELISKSDYVVVAQLLAEKVARSRVLSTGNLFSYSLFTIAVRRNSFGFTCGQSSPPAPALPLCSAKFRRCEYQINLLSDCPFHVSFRGGSNCWPQINSYDCVQITKLVATDVVSDVQEAVVINGRVKPELSVMPGEVFLLNHAYVHTQYLMEQHFLEHGAPDQGQLRVDAPTD